MTPKLEIKRLSAGAQLPKRMSAQAAGLDLSACLEGERADGLNLAPGARATVETGIAVAIPPGFEGQIRARSGLAARHGIAVLNAPGTIDADYRGELKVILINLGGASFEIRHGERIAQLVIAPVASVGLVEVEDLSTAERGEAGFGSTGR